MEEVHKFLYHRMGDKMSSHKKSASENDLKCFVEATLQEYGVGITKIMTLKTLHQAMSHKYSKSYFHDAEQLRRFVDDSKDKFTLSAGGQIVELDFHAAVKMNSTILSNGVAIDEHDHVNGDVNNKNNNTENGDVDVLSNGKKHYSHEDIQTADKVGRKESRKSLLSLFKGKKKTVENTEVDVLSSSGNSVSEDDLQEKEIYSAKESKKSVMSLFSHRRSVIEVKP